MAKASFRQRLIVSGGLLGLVILSLNFYAYRMVTRTTGQNIVNSQFSQSLVRQLTRLSESLQNAERTTYEIAVMPDAQLADSLQIQIGALIGQSQQLQVFLGRAAEMEDASQGGHDHYHQQMRAMATKLWMELTELKPIVLHFNETAVDVEKRFPGMPVLLHELLPRNNEFMEAVDLALTETINSELPQNEKNRLLKLLRDLRYYWSQQTNWLRLFVSNRYGVFGESSRSMEHSLQNRKLYMGEVQQVLAQLEKLYHAGKLGLQQSVSFEEMQAITRDYEKFFAQTQAIYLSDEWRHDLVVLSRQLKPGFNRSWAFVHDLELVMQQHNQLGIESAEHTAHTITGTMAVVGLLTFISFIIGYLVFDKFIRQPLTQIASALDKEASGESVSVPVKNYVRETSIITRAFRNMQEQVRSRQLRLQSILDSAAEGIITVDHNGLIETFNNAAQKLFGYGEEVIGQHLSILMPEEFRERHVHYMQGVVNGETLGILGEPREMSGVDSSGKRFPMSIKISEMILEGQVHYTAVVEDISQRKALIENLRKLAEHDSLTGLYNRYYFTEEVDKIIKRYQRGDITQLALMYVDLDNFKYVNDTMGHLAGDKLIVEAASLLMSRTRESDILARIGGDEFAIMLYQPDEDRLRDIAEAFRNLFETYTFMHEGKVIDIGCSIGVAVPDKETHTIEQLLSRADFACHEAKRHGRNQVYLYQHDDDLRMTSLTTDIGWAHRIKEALELQHFVLALQPICKVTDPARMYYEVLIRMRNDDGSLIMPSGFLPAAERFGLMPQIDAWVVRESIGLMKMALAADLQLRLSINLSAYSVEDTSIPELIQQLVTEHEIPAENIMLEITESVAMDNLHTASTRLRQLQELGCRTALDDFGIGYSSFAYLKDLPIDVVKIDGSFVKSIHTDPLHKALVRSINDIAHAMGKQTVAEFVENAEILAELNELGVDYAQGYLLGKPELVSDVLSLTASLQDDSRRYANE